MCFFCCCFCLILAFSLSSSLSLSLSLRLSRPGLLSWLALVWLYYSPHACGGARLSCIVASRLAQNWHFSSAQKTYGEALVCTRVVLSSDMHLCTDKVLNTSPLTSLAWSRWCWLNVPIADFHSSTLHGVVFTCYRQMHRPDRAFTVCLCGFCVLFGCLSSFDSLFSKCICGQTWNCPFKSVK